MSRHNLGAQFEAKFDSNCPGCDRAVYLGDLMGYVDDVAVCDGCYNDADLENREEQEAPVAGVEPGIQALMAAGLLSGQEPGGSGVCNAEIIAADGKVTEVAIPVPVLDLPGSKRLEENRTKGRAPRKSRAKAKPVEVPSAGSAEDAAVVALARVRDVVQLMPEPEFKTVGDFFQGARVLGASSSPEFDRPSPLQEGLQSAVDSGAMTMEQAAALGWVDPQPVATGATTPEEAYGAPVSPIEAAGPRTTEALEDFTGNYANPAADIFIDALSSAKSAPEEDAILGALDNLAPYRGVERPDLAHLGLLAVIQGAIESHPRSLQKTIGPSEIGTECDHCLAAKLAGWEQKRDGEAWLPTVGTAVHSWLEAAFARVAVDDVHPGRPRYLMERKVAVGEIDGVEVTGSTDLVDVALGMTWDWKIVGATTLREAKSSPSARYIVQQMLYARGWRRLGVRIDHVGIAYLPRNEMSLRKSVFWTAPYDESIAVAALARADQMAKNLRAMATLGAEARDAFITGLPRWRSTKQEVDGLDKLVQGNGHEGVIECRDCARYPDYPADPAAADKQLEGLI